MSEKRNRLATFIESQRADEIVTSIIIINAIFLFLSTSSYMNQHFGWWLEKIDDFALTFFICELAIRIYSLRLAFFKSSWNLFDAFVILISILPQTEFCTAIRALRILRVIRLIRFFPQLNFLLTALRKSIPGIISIVSFLGLFFFIFSIIAFNMFKGVSPAFHTIGHTLLSMFQLINDNFADIVTPLTKQMPYSGVFFIVYTIIMKFTLLNLFFGLIVNSMQNATEEDHKKSMDILQSNIDAATDLETKIEKSLETKVDLLTAEIQSLKMLLNRPS